MCTGHGINAFVMGGCVLGRAENSKKLNINLNQMGSNGSHKNKKLL